MIPSMEYSFDKSRKSCFYVIGVVYILSIGLLAFKFPIHAIYFSDLFVELDKLLTFAL